MQRQRARCNSTPDINFSLERNQCHESCRCINVKESVSVSRSGQRACTACSTKPLCSWSWPTVPRASVPLACRITAHVAYQHRSSHVTRGPCSVCAPCRTSPPRTSRTLHHNALLNVSWILHCSICTSLYVFSAMAWGDRGPGASSRVNGTTMDPSANNNRTGNVW